MHVYILADTEDGTCTCARVEGTLKCICVSLLTSPEKGSVDHYVEKTALSTSHYLSKCTNGIPIDICMQQVTKFSTYTWCM